MLLVKVGNNSIKEFMYGIELLKPSQTGSNITHSLNQYASRIEIIESLFAKSLALHVVLDDGGGLYDKIGISIGDYISLNVERSASSTPEDFRRLTLRFVVTEVGGAALLPSAKAREIHIRAVSFPALLNQSTRISRRLNMTGPNMFKEILRSNLQTTLPSSMLVTTSASEERLDIVFPSCRAFDALDMIAARTSAKTPKNGSNYLVHYTFDGKFSFRSVRDIAKEGKVHEYFFFPTKNFTNQSADFYRFSIFKQHKHMRADSQCGVQAASQTVAVDWFARTFDVTHYRHTESKRLLSVMGKHSPFDPVKAEGNLENPIRAAKPVAGRHGTAVSTTYIPSTTAYQKPEMVANHLPYDQAQKAGLDSISYTIEVLGNTDLRSGDTIDVVTPALYQADGETETDLFFNGKFMIGHIRHVIVQADSFTTYADLFKDGYDVNFGETR